MCTYEGETHGVGEEWPAADGCSRCRYVSSGEVSCTDKDCTTSEDVDGGV